MLRASYGRFNQGVLTGELSPIHPGVTPTTTMAYDAATGGYTPSCRWSIRTSTSPSIPTRARPAPTSTPSASIARSPPRLAAAVAYIRKRGSDFIAWTDVGGQYREETRTLADGRSCRCSC